MSNARPPITNRDQITTVLHAAGILTTPQRIEIATILLEKKQHLSAEDVLSRLQSEQTAVSKATVYNTLKLFADRGLLREVMVDATRLFYDSNTEPHHHFYNVDDGELIDVGPEELSIVSLPGPPAGTATDAVDVVIRIRNLEDSAV